MIKIRGHILFKTTVAWVSGVSGEKGKNPSKISSPLAP